MRITVIIFHLLGSVSLFLIAREIGRHGGPIGERRVCVCVCVRASVCIAREL